MVDKVTQDRISKLHPSVRDEVTKIIEEINTKFLTGRAKVRIAQGLRTFAEQDALYAQGRTKPGKKVTNAKGAPSVIGSLFSINFDTFFSMDSPSNDSTDPMKVGIYFVFFISC